MNTRRIPFQFSTTDPLARQRELEKRFGLQPTCPKMYVDMNHPLTMGTTPKETSSPRLQHRVPIFAEGYDHPIHSSSVDSVSSVPDNKKPKVRVIPIEVEGADRSQRHRTYSGPAGTLKDHCDNLVSERTEVPPPFKRFNFEPSKPKHDAEPRIYNIPVQIEGVNNVSRCPKVNETVKPKSPTPTIKKCPQSTLPSKIKSPVKNVRMQPEPDNNKVDQPKNNVETSLKKIEDVLTEFKAYETGVADFTGTSKDKQYRYLDEMLTRCMLRLDDIDTMGNEEIRLARKNAIKKVQASIDLLESKANVETVSSEISQNQSIPDENNDVEMRDDQVEDEKEGGSVEDKTNSEITGVELTENEKKDQSQDATTKIESETESTEATLEEKSNSEADIEMCEVPQDKTSNVNTDSSEIAKTEDVMQGAESSTSSLQQQENSISEIESSLVEMNSTNELSSKALESDNGVKQSEISKESLINDLEMLDEEKLTPNPAESHFPGETKEKISVNKSDEVSEVEMVEIGDIPSLEPDKKNECEIKKEFDNNFDCSEQKTNNVGSNVQVISIIPSDIGDKCVPNVSDQDVKCASSQPDTDQTIDVKQCC